MDKFSMAEIEAAVKLYNYIGREIEGETMQEDIENYWLTVHTGRDKQDYCWYYDGSPTTNAAINIATGEIITDEARIEELFC